MADAPPTTNKPAAMSGSQFTRKLGPLPVWAWAAVILGGYYLYNHFRNAKSTAAAPSSDPSNPGTGTYVPGFDAASGAGGSSYSTPPGTTITNNYYGQKPDGGGTSTGGTGGSSGGTGGHTAGWVADPIGTGGSGGGTGGWKGSGFGAGGTGATFHGWTP